MRKKFNELDSNGGLRFQLGILLLILGHFFQNAGLYNRTIDLIVIAFVGICFFTAWRARIKEKVKIQEDERTIKIELLSIKYSWVLLIILILSLYLFERYSTYYFSVEIVLLGLLAAAAFVKVVSLFILHTKK